MDVFDGLFTIAAVYFWHLSRKPGCLDGDRYLYRTGVVMLLALVLGDLVFWLRMRPS